MAKRFKVRMAKDQRLFTRTALKTKKISVVPTNSRGAAKL